MPGIFISYRRSDSTDATGRIHDRLLSEFGRGKVFKDVDSIPIGTDFRGHLTDVLKQCRVVIVVVGAGWIDAKSTSNKRRLEDPEDFVRIELEAALARDIPVIPVLVGNATMPTETQLPTSLAAFAFRQATVVRPDPDFHRDMDRLIKALTGLEPSVSPTRWMRAVAKWVRGAKSSGNSATTGQSKEAEKPALVPLASAVVDARPRLSSGGVASSNPEANRYFESAMVREQIHADIPRSHELLERALELDPHFAEARASHGITNWLLLDSGCSNDSALLSEAEDEMRRALKDDPKVGRAHVGFALVFLMQGRMDLIPAEIEQALQTIPADKTALHILVHYHQYSGDYEGARRVGREILERQPLFFPPRMIVGDLFRQEGDLVAAMQEQEKILEQEPQNSYALRFLTRTYMDAGKLVQARETIERTRVEDSGSFYTRLVRGTLAVLEGNPELGRREVDREVLKWGALVAHNTSEVAVFYAVLGEVTEALDWLDRAVRGGDERAEYFQRYPLFENIRDHPRFKQIMATIAYRRTQRSG